MGAPARQRQRWGHDRHPAGTSDDADVPVADRAAAHRGAAVADLRTPLPGDDPPLPRRVSLPVRSET